MKINKEYPKISRELHIILAEDDPDDRLLFNEAIKELPVSVQVTAVPNGEELIAWLNDHENDLPDALYLDLNMPRKNGFAALSEIKRNIKLQDLPVFIFSTATKNEMIKQVYNDAAHYYIQKPIHFQDLKKLIYKSLALLADHDTALPGKERFMLTTD